MNPVFLDTIGLVALWDEADQWHSAAELAYAQFTRQRRAMVTTSFVLLECGNTSARRPYRKHVSFLREKLELRNELIFPNDQDWRSAWEEYNERPELRAGIVDHVSFAVMRRLGVTDAFTNDRHFAAAGFVILF